MGRTAMEIKSTLGALPVPMSTWVHVTGAAGHAVHPLDDPPQSAAPLQAAPCVARRMARPLGGGRVPVQLSSGSSTVPAAAEGRPQAAEQENRISTLPADATVRAVPTDGISKAISTSWLPCGTTTARNA